MSTRCVLTVIDDRNTFHIYRHHDGYPDNPSGVLATIPQVLEYAWPLPRFEAMDFAAALIRAWKPAGGGGIYCTSHYNDHGDLAYRYEIRCLNGKLNVKAFSMSDPSYIKQHTIPQIAD